MDAHTRSHLDGLKSALGQLRATGDKGFEGLMSLVLGAIAGIPFRLSASGSQFGVDGDSAYIGDHVSFECKRYGDDIPREKVLTKLAELLLRQDIDLWVLCATSEVSSQLASDVRDVATQQGLETLILDWVSDTQLPSLAVAIAAAPEKSVSDFLISSGCADAERNLILSALGAVRIDSGYSAHAGRIQAALNLPLLSQESARRSNNLWLKSVFADRDEAKRQLGQPIAPNDSRRGKVVVRSTIIEPLKKLMTDHAADPALFVLGDEGVGKSWLVAQAWSQLSDPPLMLVLTADAVARENGPRDLKSLLVHALPQQTQTASAVQYDERWKRKIDRWLHSGVPPTPRLVIVIDGINQKPNWDWARQIELSSHELATIGGRLVITSRTPYFDAFVRDRLNRDFNKVKVPDWLPPERDDILRGRGIQLSDLAASVGRALLNPRLLDIALQLLENDEIVRLNELHVSRLLFEHIRTAERDSAVPQPVHQFVKMLRDHAEQMIHRVSQDQRDDIRIFDHAAAVIDGRFFHPLDDDAAKYELRDEGLTLALGFALLDHLQKAHRNGRDVSASVYELVDPISALDNTASVMMSAITIGCVGANYSDPVRSALLIAFADLQNVNESDLEAFSVMAARCPNAFMLAAEHLWLAGGRQSNSAWIRAALFNAASEDRAWTAMSKHLSQWLQLYSLDPERSLVGISNHPGPERDDKLRENEMKLREYIAGLSMFERQLLGRLVQSPGDLSRLSALAFELMAGKPLQPFVAAFVAWCFSNALNYDYGSPHDAFVWLGRLNRVDWAEARSSLIDYSSALDASDTSRVGKWALVGLLRFTGGSTDGIRAEAIVVSLTKDRRTPLSWRLKEQWCASDPCDPNSVAPDNLAPTALAYAELDVGKLHSHFGTTSEDHLFESMRPAMARFRPEVAVSKYHELARHVFGRSEMSLRQGLISIGEHSPLVSYAESQHLIRLRGHGFSNVTRDLSDKDRNFLSQECLLLAFPNLSGDEQLDALCEPAALDTFFSIHLIPKFHMAATSRIVSRIESAIETGDKRALCYLLEFLLAQDVNSSVRLRQIIDSLLVSNDADVRLRIFSLLAEVGPDDSLKTFCNGSWRADQEPNDAAAGYGSMALIRGVNCGLASPLDVVTRIAPRYYGRLAHVASGATVFAPLLDDAIALAARAEVNAPTVDLETQVESGNELDLGRVTITELHVPATDPLEALKRVDMGLREYERLQEENHDAYCRFRAELAEKKALIVLDHFSPDQFAAIVGACPQLADRWLALFLTTPRQRKPLMHNFALLLAYFLARDRPQSALRLLNAYEDSATFVRMSHGHARTELRPMVIWSAKPSPEFDSLRRRRLDSAINDYVLSLDVLTAEQSGQTEFLDKYVLERLASGVPADQARALMVIGFRDSAQEHQDLLRRYGDSGGLVGEACNAAMYAYERNVWSRHWFECMCKSTKPIEFWRYSELFTEIVDARLDLWGSRLRSSDGLNKMFGVDLRNPIRRRLEKWRNDREKKLFGVDKPGPRFVH